MMLPSTDAARKLPVHSAAHLHTWPWHRAASYVLLEAYTHRQTCGPVGSMLKVGFNINVCLHAIQKLSARHIAYIQQQAKLLPL